MAYKSSGLAERLASLFGHEGDSESFKQLADILSAMSLENIPMGASAIESGMAPVSRQLPAVIRSGPLKKVMSRLLGFSDDAARQVPFGEQQLPSTLRVRVKWKDGTQMVDEVKGLTPKHALEAAHRNWEGATIEPLGIVE